MLSTPLDVQVSATPTSGFSPLTVSFSATPTGGTGTYSSFLWEFGDGDNGSGPVLQYTYPRAGEYNATLVVTDSSGRNVTRSIAIDVSGRPPAPPARSAPVPAYAIFVLPAVVAVVAATVAAGLYLAWVVRRPSAPTGGDDPAAVPVEPVPPAEVGPSGPASPEELAEATASRPASDDARSLAERVLVHLEPGTAGRTSTGWPPRILARRGWPDGWGSARAP